MEEEELPTIERRSSRFGTAPSLSPGQQVANHARSDTRRGRSASIILRLQSQREALEYHAVPTHDTPEEKEVAEELSWGEQLLESHSFTNTMALIILANGIVIGLETDIRSYGGWRAIECVFLSIFIGEVIFKLCVEGCRFWDPHEEDFVWNLFDLLIIGLGVFDTVADMLGLSATPGFATIFRMVRLLRVLRILRLIHFLKPLVMLAVGLIEACKAVCWVTILMGCVLYVTAIVLVRTLGDPSPSDPNYDFLVEHFQSIPTTMITLFVLMSSPNLPIYQEEDGLLAHRPFFCIFLIMFICFGSFGMIAMLTGVINESVFEKNDVRKQDLKMEHEHMRVSLGKRAADLFETLPLDKWGCATTEDLKHIAEQSAELLDQAGVQIAHGDVVKFLELMDEEEDGVITMKEFVTGMERMAVGLSPLSILRLQHVVGMCNNKLTEQLTNMATIQDTIEWQVERTSEHVDKILDLITEEHANHRGHLAEKVNAQMQRTSEEVERILQIVTDAHEEHRNHTADTMETLLSRTLAEVNRVLQLVIEEHNEHRSHLAKAMESQMQSTAREVDRILHAIGKGPVEQRSHYEGQSGSQESDHQSLIIDKIEAHELRMAEQVDRILTYLTTVQPEIPVVTSAHGLLHPQSQLQAHSDISKCESSLLAAMSKQAKEVTTAVQSAIDKKFSDIETQLALRFNLRDSNEKRMQTIMLSQIQGLVKEAGSETRLNEIHCLVQDCNRKEDMIQNSWSDLVRLVQESKNSVVRVAKAQDTFTEDVDTLMSKVSGLEKQVDSVHAQFVSSSAELGGDIITSISELISLSLSTMKQEFQMQRSQTPSLASPTHQSLATMSSISREATRTSLEDTESLPSKPNA